MVSDVDADFVADGAVTVIILVALSVCVVLAVQLGRRESVSDTTCVGVSVGECWVMATDVLIASVSVRVIEAV